MALQLDFWLNEEQCEIKQMRDEIDAMKESMGKQRRSLFARQGDVIKGVIDLRERVEHIERGLCRGVK